MTISGAATTPPREPVLPWVMVFLAVALLLHLVQGVPYDADSAYHLAVARLLGEHGHLRAFPWTSHSWLADHYADKELLFHLALVPVSGLPLGVAGKIAGTVFTAAVLTVIFLVLRREQVPQAGTWTLLLLAGSGTFMFRVALLRPHVVAIALAVLATWLASRRRLVPLGVVCAVYAWSYVAWLMPVVLAALTQLAELRGPRRPSWKVPAAATAGLCLGVVLHPDFPANVMFTRVVLVDVLFRASWRAEGDIALGGEFDPLDPLEALLQLSLPAALLLLGAVTAWRHRAGEPLAMSFALPGAALLLLTLRTPRLAEYAVPFCMIAAALWCARRWKPHVVPVLLAATVAVHGVAGDYPLARFAARTDIFPAPLARVLDKTVPRGARVFTCSWEFTGELLLALPGREYMIALDPTLFWLRDHQAYRAWRELVRAPGLTPSTVVREAFHKDYVLCESTPNNAAFLRALGADPGAVPLVRSALWNAFALRAEPPAPTP